MSYTMIDNGRAIRCDTCGTASYHAHDVRHKYCGRCRKFHTGRVTLSRDELIERGYTLEPTLDPNAYQNQWLANPVVDTTTECRAEPDARPSSSDIDYGSSSSSDCSSSSSDTSGGWSGD